MTRVTAGRHSHIFQSRRTDVTDKQYLRGERGSLQATGQKGVRRKKLATAIPMLNRDYGAKTHGCGYHVYGVLGVLAILEGETNEVDRLFSPFLDICHPKLPIMAPSLTMLPSRTLQPNRLRSSSLSYQVSQHP